MSNPVRIPVFVELYGEAHHGLHGFVGEGEFHEDLFVSAGEGTCNFQAFSFTGCQPHLKRSQYGIQLSGLGESGEKNGGWE